MIIFLGPARSMRPTNLLLPSGNPTPPSFRHVHQVTASTPLVSTFVQQSFEPSMVIRPILTWPYLEDR